MTDLKRDELAERIGARLDMAAAERRRVRNVRDSVTPDTWLARRLRDAEDAYRQVEIALEAAREALA